MKKERTKFQLLIRSHLREVKGSLSLAALCMLGYTMTELLAPWPLKIIFDHILLNKPWPAWLAWLHPLLQAEGGFQQIRNFTSIDHNGKVLAIVVLALSIMVLAAARGMCSYFQLFITSRVGFQLVYRLRRELFAHLARLSLSYHTRARSGELLTKITSDTSTLKDIFAQSTLEFGSHILMLLGMFGIMFVLNATLSLIVLATFPVLLYALFFIYARVKASARKQREREGRIASRISEVLRSVSLVQAFAQEKYEQERFETESNATLEESIKTARLEAAASRTVEIISSFGLCAVVFFGAVKVLDGQLTPGDVLIFTAYLTSLYKPLRQLARLSSQFSKASVSAERISEILAAETETPDLPNAIPASHLQGAIAFHHVSFNYSAGKSVLRDVSFTAQPGQRVALVGASGAGKSTIASLILRLYDPSEGAIFVDGVPIKLYERESLRREIGVVLQDTILFGASMRENIAYGKPNATIEEIELAARLAYAHDFIRALPEGYDTVIGERGSTLSGGQRQRICLARAFLKKPSLLILDEPTSAIDAESSALIQQAIAQVQRDKTTIVIAHHFSFIQDFDLILVLNDGAIVERGTHEELLRRRGYYYDLYRLQGEQQRTIDLPSHHHALPQVNWEASGIYPLHV